MKRAVSGLSWMLIAGLTLCCCVTTPTDVHAQEDPTPPTSPTEVELPRDNTKAVPQDFSNGWTKISPGTTDAQKEKAKKAKKIKVVLKKKNNGSLPREKIVIKKIGYFKKNTGIPGTYVEEEVTSVGSANGSQANIDIPDDADTSKAIYVKVYSQNKDDHLEVVPEETLNKDFTWGDAGGDTIVSIGHGGGAVVSVDGELTTTILDVAVNAPGLSASDYSEPDLMFWCTDLIETGEILFCPVGEFSFGNTPQDILVFDSEGNDLISSEAITLGEPYITTRGDLAIPVDDIDPALPAFGMVVRGVEVDMNQGADDDSVHSYTTGGTSLRFLCGDTCPIADGTRVLDNWEALSWSASYSLGSEFVEIDEEEVAIGAFTSTVSGSTNNGYLEGIVIEGNAANSIKNGEIILRGIWGCQFGAVESTTRVHVLDAETGNDLYHEEISAEIAANAFGDLVVTLNNIESYCASNRVKIVITGVYMAYNAPAAWGVGYKFQCFGSSLRAPLRSPRVIIEGESPEASDPSGPLPQAPIEVEGWTPIATG